MKIKNNFKFRVWSKKLKELKYFTFNDIGHAMYMMKPDERFVWTNCGSKTIILNKSSKITQWTGLKDRNGVEVYCGDILSKKLTGIGNIASEVFGPSLEVVRFVSGSFIVDRAPIWQLTYPTTPDILEDCVVIGNIFENEDLLEQ